MKYFGILFFLYVISYVAGGKRFHKWDELVRNTRQASNLPFVPLSRKSSSCPQAQERQYDALRRRESNLLVPPQSQGDCGSCWAFASAHAYADQININQNNSGTILSTDYLTRCAPSVRNNGCCGNSPNRIFPYLLQQGFQLATCRPYTLENYIPQGLTQEQRISFKQRNPLMCPANCADGSSLNSVRPSGYTRIERQDVIPALSAGPVYASLFVTNVQIDPYSLYNYGCGVLSFPSPYNINSIGGHAVEIVDYSSASFGGPSFFVVKNSWGTSFGENGYFMIAQNAPIFFNFYTLTPGASSSASNSTSLSTQATCGVNQANTSSIMVETVAEFGLEEITNLSLVRCLQQEVVPSLALDSVINGTQQVVEGILFDLTARARVMGCKYSFAAVRMTVMQELNDTFTLLSYNYEELLNSSSSNCYSTFSFCTLLLSFLFALIY